MLPLTNLALILVRDLLISSYYNRSTSYLKVNPLSLKLYKLPLFSLKL